MSEEMIREQIKFLGYTLEMFKEENDLGLKWLGGVCLDFKKNFEYKKSLENHEALFQMNKMVIHNI